MGSLQAQESFKKGSSYYNDTESRSIIRVLASPWQARISFNQRRYIVMKMMREAIDKEDFDRIDKGLPPRPKPKVNIPEPDPPEVPDQIKVEDVPKEKFVGLAGVRKRVVSNAEGVRFMGFDVSIDVEGKTLNGWMAEKDLRDLMQTFKEKIDPRLRGVI